MLTFMWSIGINVSLPLFVFPPPPAGYGFSSLTIALLYIGPMIASVLGELFGHFFNDWLANSYIKRHHGIYEPETRLWMAWISTAFMTGGLIFIGFVFENLMGFYIIEVAWGIYLFGMITSVVAVNGTLSRKCVLMYQLTRWMSSRILQCRHLLFSISSVQRVDSLSITFRFNGHKRTALQCRSVPRG